MGDEGAVFGGSAGQVGRGVVECGVGGEGLAGGPVEGAGLVEGDGGVAVEAGSGTVGDEAGDSAAGGVDDVVTPEAADADVEAAPVEVVAVEVVAAEAVVEDAVGQGAEVTAEPVPDADEPAAEDADGPAPTEFFAPVDAPSGEDVTPADSDPEATKFFAPPVTVPHVDDREAADESTRFLTPVAVPSDEAAPAAEKTEESEKPEESDAPEEHETFLTAEAMEFFSVPAPEAKPADSPEAPVATSAASTFGVPEIFRASEPTEFLTAPEADEPVSEPVEFPKVERDPDDVETVVFAGVLELDEPPAAPVLPAAAPAKSTARQKNNPAVLTGVLTMVLCSVLGLGLISSIDNATPVAGRAVAAPFAPAPTSAATEPVRPRAVQRLEDHPLLVTPKSLPEVTCDLPRFGTSDDQLAAYYAAGVKCLDEAWGPVLKDANLPFEPPELDASPELSDGPCGAAPASEDAVAYYCGRNRMIYMPTGRLRENGGGDRPATHLATLAHEYGHHVQAMSGMLRAADVKIVGAGEKTPAGLEMSRRIELQANCFAGMFLGAVAGKGSISRELANRAEEDFQYAMEEAPEKNAHGSPVNQGNWALSGFDANTTDACNTYAAPAAEVG